MNLMLANSFTVPRRWLVAGLLGLILLPRAWAQTSSPAERWLLIFDTSATMKKYLPGTEAEVKGLLASQISGQLQAGDSLGVWTFGKELHTGQLPLVTWDPERAAATASNIVALVHKANYTGDTTWTVLQPVLGQLIKNSERLTVIVFCDGLGDVDWTPYNDGINRTFSQALPDRKKARQPFVLLVRTQRGQFTGCTVNFPPGALNVPPFPLIPEPVKEIPVATNPPPPVVPVVKAPVISAPPLIIVGTNVTMGTNAPVLPKTMPSMVTSIPFIAAVRTNFPALTNHPVVLPGQSAPLPQIKMNEVEKAPPTTNQSSITQTNAPVVATVIPDSDSGSSTLVYVGISLFAAAAALIIFLMLRAARRPHGSLITCSMQSDLRLPPRH